MVGEHAVIGLELNEGCARGREVRTECAIHQEERKKEFIYPVYHQQQTI